MHWYKQTGEPCYEVPNKSKGGMRPTTLADARKLNLVPSVTEICKIIHTHSLQSWIEEQIVKAAWEIDKTEPEELMYEAWRGKVLEKASEISRDAANKGSDIHKAIEEWLTTYKITNNEPYFEWKNTFAGWWIKQEWWEKDYPIFTEGYIPTCDGYGGRYDIFIGSAKTIIIDLKTQNAKGKPFNFYRSWGRQLAAYAQALGATRLISVVMDSQDSSKIDSKEWTDYPELLAEFKAAQLLWKSENNFNGDTKCKCNVNNPIVVQDLS